MSKYGRMSDEELKELSNRRNKNGSFKNAAFQAQRELYKRNQWVHEEIVVDNGYRDMRREEIDYNGFDEEEDV